MPPAERAIRADAEETRNRIMDAAEELFAEHGYGATSLRQVTRTAAVNLGAVNYHFGNKEGLLLAVFERRAVPINALRTRKLRQLLQDTQQPSVEQIMHAFFSPVLDEKLTRSLQRLIARLYGEPQFGQRVIWQNFMPTVQEFLAALKTALPRVSDEDLLWRFHFVIGAMVQTLNMGHPPGLESESDRQVVFEKLLAFAVAGLQHA